MDPVLADPGSKPRTYNGDIAAPPAALCSAVRDAKLVDLSLDPKRQRQVDQAAVPVAVPVSNGPQQCLSNMVITCGSSRSCEGR